MMRFFLSGVLLTLLVTAVGCSSDRKSEIRVMSFNVRLSPHEDFDGENCPYIKPWGKRKYREDHEDTPDNELICVF